VSPPRHLLYGEPPFSRITGSVHRSFTIEFSSLLIQFKGKFELDNPLPYLGVDISHVAAMKHEYAQCCRTHLYLSIKTISISISTKQFCVFHTMSRCNLMLVMLVKLNAVCRIQLIINAIPLPTSQTGHASGARHRFVRKP
jgi:hypothetical protein